MLTFKIILFLLISTPSLCSIVLFFSSFFFSFFFPLLFRLESYILTQNTECAVAKYQNESTKKEIIRLEQVAQSHMQRALASHGALAILYGRHSKHYIKKSEVLRCHKFLPHPIGLGYGYFLCISLLVECVISFHPLIKSGKEL